MLTREQLINLLTRHGDTEKLLLLVAQEGPLVVVPNQDTAEFRNPFTWPKYVVRCDQAVNLVAGMGPDAALDYINQTIATLIGPPETDEEEPTSVIGRMLSRLFD
ncbi:hypothetical protein [Rhodococcoides kyotonense]|uniref:Uncharacterized protein n=1 Tax=Rhodococcoides kyotonense TaxID=398843 RepID=A0A239FLY4_9NOCA|nr:hypothetical protein [Rhodococcus kyotonensis]SNS57890.1 hypothetical protein SAMN05421642_103364 [Rhodococcus kyotonensis]